MVVTYYVEVQRPFTRRVVSSLEGGTVFNFLPVVMANGRTRIAPLWKCSPKQIGLLKETVGECLSEFRVFLRRGKGSIRERVRKLQFSRTQVRESRIRAQIGPLLRREKPWMTTS
ncbi:MAG: hypothetical protein A3J04_02415 [Candidatus Ryanbacteria bacterium RIFCSPLOWO2_02_FULL_47_14]|uniref:Uncharacterized protein n=1 Tax=Candidatus Ryanbacteria bacterium RIFCSPLOWO2_02_FULL_47_14 TaxID=1802129 RepID=A0A1G2GXB2_9BACT|nr:MAG: hypothetical protein A3J04_02415 [Candidatus Ryanbacteria bacterium RIFCSPLOWO2_02_FULL_47_14]